MLGLILTIVIVGLIAGAVARLVVPGQDGFQQPSGIIGSIVGAIIVLIIWSRLGERRGVRP